MQNDCWILFSDGKAKYFHGETRPGELAAGDILLWNPDLKKVEGIPVHEWSLDYGLKIVPKTKEQEHLPSLPSPPKPVYYPPAAISLEDKQEFLDLKHSVFIQQEELKDHHSALMNHKINIEQQGDLFESVVNQIESLFRLIIFGFSLALILFIFLLCKSANAAGNSPFIINQTCTDGAYDIITQKCLNATGSGGASGPYLPLSAGSAFPLTGDLYLGNHNIYNVSDIIMSGSGAISHLYEISAATIGGPIYVISSVFNLDGNPISNTSDLGFSSGGDISSSGWNLLTGGSIDDSFDNYDVNGGVVINGADNPAAYFSTYGATQLFGNSVSTVLWASSDGSGSPGQNDDTGTPSVAILDQEDTSGQWSSLVLQGPENVYGVSNNLKFYDTTSGTNGEWLLNTGYEGNSAADAFAISNNIVGAPAQFFLNEDGSGCLEDCYISWDTEFNWNVPNGLINSGSYENSNTGNTVIDGAGQVFYPNNTAALDQFNNLNFPTGATLANPSGQILDNNSDVLFSSLGDATFPTSIKMTSLTAHGVLTLNSSHLVQSIVPSTSGNILTSNGTDWISSAPAAPAGKGSTSWSFATGSITSVVSNQIVGYGYTGQAMVVRSVAGVATSFTCAVTNPTLTLYDCGTSIGACTTGRTALGSITIAAANTPVSSTGLAATIASGHYWSVETTAGACTVLNVVGSAEVGATLQ